MAWQSKRRLRGHLRTARRAAFPLRLLGKIRSDKSEARENQDTALKDNIRPSLLNYLPPFCHVSFAPELSAPTPPQPAPASSCSARHPWPRQAQEQGSPHAPGTDPLSSFNTLKFPRPGQLRGHSPRPPSHQRPLSRGRTPGSAQAPPAARPLHRPVPFSLPTFALKTLQTADFGAGCSPGGAHLSKATPRGTSAPWGCKSGRAAAG